MHQQKIVVALAAALLVNAAFPVAAQEAASGRSQKYIAHFQDEVPRDSIEGMLAKLPQARIESSWSGLVNAALLSGLTPAQALQLRQQPGVVSVEIEGHATIDDSAVPAASRGDLDAAGPAVPKQGAALLGIQPSPPQNLDRIDRRTSVLDQQYVYDYAGQGVTVYVVDSGLRATHSEFVVSTNPYVTRASNAFNAFPSEPDVDGSGHGTHMAGVIAGKTMGVAKGATVKSVRVCHGDPQAPDCPESAIISGLQYIKDNTPPGSAPAQRTVVNISLNMKDMSTALRSAITNLVATRGIFLVSAAGNSGGNVCTANSPALTAPGNHVVGFTMSNMRHKESGWGTCVFMHAPGYNIRSANADGDTLTNKVQSGASPAAAHVSGAAALIFEEFPSAWVLHVEEKLVERSGKFDDGFIQNFWDYPGQYDAGHVTPARMLCTRQACTTETP